MMKLSRKIGAIGAVSLMLAVILAACGGEDPTATPRPAATPTPDAMMEDKAEPTPTPEAMMEATAEPAPDTSGSTGPAPTATPVPRPTATPLPVDPGFDAEAYFGGKTISMMVGYNPGGGTDAQGRFMSRAWSKYIPGSPRIVVRNLTPNVVPTELRLEFEAGRPDDIRRGDCRNLRPDNTGGPIRHAGGVDDRRYLRQGPVLDDPRHPSL